jgi:fructokinase
MPLGLPPGTQDEPDPKGVIIPFLEQADLVKISDADLKYLYNMEIVTGLINPGAVAALLPRAAGVLVTAGDEGAAYSFKSPTKAEHSGFVPVFKVWRALLAALTPHPGVP